jgi:hypothetical protein
MLELIFLLCKTYILLFCFVFELHFFRCEESNVWSELARLMREDHIDIAEAARKCAVLLHSAAFANENVDMQKLGRPLISIGFSLYKGEEVDVSLLSSLGCKALWDPLVGANVRAHTVNVATLLPPIARQTDNNPFLVTRPVSAKQWLARGMPFRASDAIDAPGDINNILAAGLIQLLLCVFFFLKK